MGGDLIVELRDNVLWITLNRPELGNSVTDAMAGQLANALIHADERARLVVLRGAGSEFCTGRAPPPPAAGATEALARRRSTEVVFDCYGAFRSCRVPIVGLVQGQAFGFGCSIAALCDLTIATDKATFQVPEMMHRIMPTMVMSSLVDRLSRKAISHLVYTSQIISPERALSFGIVGDIVAHDRSREALQEVCNAILGAPRPATEGVKEYLRTAMSMDVQGAVDFARNIHATINSSSEMRR
jgi:enoyl-CoA hydratase